MARQALYNDLDLVSRGYKINPDWNRNFREDQDKVTKVINGILDMTLGHYIEKERTMLSEFYFTKYWGVGNYCFVYKMKEEYNQTEVLIGTIMELTDEVLRWYDLTTMVNFNILIVTPYETFRCTYFDLLYEYVTMSDGNGRFSSVKYVINNYPRIQQMKEWVIRNPEYKRVTQKTSLAVDPYSYMDRGREQREFLQLRMDGGIAPYENRHLKIRKNYYDSTDSHIQIQRVIEKSDSVFSRLKKMLKLNILIKK
jgi:hypothetical protein